jgi:hypothetical protein
MRPERIFATPDIDDDGDGMIDEALPPGAEGVDCDGDGCIGTVEAFVGNEEQVFCSMTQTAG